MSTPAERLIRIAADDYTMQDVPAEHLVSMLVDCSVALAVRTGKTPRDVLEDTWKTAMMDDRWRELMALRRLAGG